MWEIYAYHNVVALFGIFNGVAAIMGSATYLSAIAAVAFCGFVAALAAYVFAPDKLVGWRWIATVVITYAVLFLPRVAVQIIDKTGGTPPRVVANVPLGMAALGGLTSTIGHTLTELFETAFQTLPGPASLPSALSYQSNGLMFGARAIQETRRVAFPDPAVRADILNFVNNCTVYDIADGTISPADFARTADLWSLMSNTNPARFSPVNTAAGVTTDTCVAVYASINARMAPQIADTTVRLALRLNPQLDPAAANAAVQDQILQAYVRSRIADAAATAAGIIRQNAVINAVMDASELGCQRINDPACMMLATGRAQAVAQQNAAWINGAKISEQALPIVRNAAEALTFALFPFVVLLMFLSSGRYAVALVIGYATVLVSIQLWPPLFAILNYLATLYAEMDQAAAADVGGGAKSLSLVSAPAIYSNAISGQAVVSYLIIGIPFLAYSLANKLAGFGTALTGGLSGLQSTIGNVSAAAAAGNAQLGNVTMDQRNVTPMDSNAYVSRRQDILGNWHTLDGTGRVATSYLRNEGVVSRIVSARVSADDVRESSRTAEVARTDLVSATNERSAALTDAVSRMSARSSGRRDSSGATSSSYESLARSAQEIQAISESGARLLNLTSSEFQRIAFNAAAGVGTGGLSPVTVNMRGELGKTYQAGLTETDQKVLQALSSEQLSKFKEFGDRLTLEASTMTVLASEDREGKELASRLTTTTSRVETAQSSLSEREAVAERLSTSYSRGEEIRIDLAQLPESERWQRRFTELAAVYRHDSQAIQIALASELASTARLPPTEYRDGSPVLATAAEIRSAAEADRRGGAFDPRRLGDARQQFDDRTRSAAPVLRPGQAPSTPTGKAPSGGPDPDSPEIGRKVKEQIGGFEQRNAIVRDSDGTVRTEKSEFEENRRKVGADLHKLGRDARQLARDAAGWVTGKDKNGSK